MSGLSDSELAADTDSAPLLMSDTTESPSKGVPGWPRFSINRRTWLDSRLSIWRHTCSTITSSKLVLWSTLLNP